MKLKKITAFVIALAMAGPCGYGTSYEKEINMSTVSAAAIAPLFIECEMNSNEFYLNRGDRITLEHLVSRGLKITKTDKIYHDLPEDEEYGKETYNHTDIPVSECMFIFPDEFTEGVNTIEISYNPTTGIPGTDTLTYYLEVYVSYANEDNVRYQLSDMDLREIYIDGEWYNYVCLGNVLCSNGVTDLTVPSEIEGNRIFELENHCISEPQLKNINISDGILKMADFSVNCPGELECLTVPESVIEIGQLELGNASIRGYIGSYAEKYASQNGYKFDAIGDVSGDDEINALDVIKMVKYLYGIEEFDEEMMRRADGNLDSSVNVLDFIRLKQQLIEPKISSLGASFDGALAAPDLKNIQKPSSDINTDGFNRFAAESAGEILLNTEDKKGTENTVYSPLSVYMALSMATECAASDTQKEMLAALHADSVDELRKENSALFESLYFDDYNTYLKIANSVWMNQKYSFIQDTLQTLADKYYTVSFEKDFSDEKVPKEISQWIYKNTSGKISPEIKMHKNDKGEVDEVMKLINTVTFKEKWTKEFGTASEDDFYLRDGSRITCDFLHRKTEYPTENIGFADNYMKYALEMGDGYRMNFILPDEGTDVNEIVSDKDTMLEIINDDIEYSKRKIVFSVPKFDIESKFDLIEASRKMGINLAFDTYLADFSGVVDFEKSNIPSAYIGEITHEAKIVIDEKGCEAAAYTIISMYPSAAAPSLEEPVYFELNRPFFYYVSDSEGTPVFSGIINNPVLN
ncbi:MAG: serpin family protein [Oscillospiraceae bacterium]|nr:serpin family protein [Oscillospiraceae bacterium]